MTGEWRDQAACRDQAVEGWGSAFDPKRDAEPDVLFGVRIREAKAICRTCPVLVPCAEYAQANHLIGVWGGSYRSGPDRESMVRRNEARHGTESGARAHRRRGEVPCGSCRVAEAARVDAPAAAPESAGLVNERRQAAGQVHTPNRARAVHESAGIGRINYGGWRGELVRAVTAYWRNRPAVHAAATAAAKEGHDTGDGRPDSPGPSRPHDGQP